MDKDAAFPLYVFKSYSYHPPSYDYNIIMKLSNKDQRPFRHSKNMKIIFKRNSVPIYKGINVCEHGDELWVPKKYAICLPVEKLSIARNDCSTELISGSVI